MLSSLFCHSTGSSFPCQVGHLKETRKTLPVVQQKKNASLVHLWIFTRGQCLLKIIQTFYLLGKGKGITSSITTTLELHLPSIPLVTKKIPALQTISTVTISVLLTRSVLFIHYHDIFVRLHLFRFTDMETTWLRWTVHSVPLCFDLVLPLEKVLVLCFFVVGGGWLFFLILFCFVFF